jgi:hypothetical protein
MEQIITGVLIGAASLAVIVLATLFLWQMFRIVQQVENAINELKKVAEVFQKSADMSSSLTAVVMVNRKMISSIESMTAAVRVFTGLVLHEEPQDEAQIASPIIPPPRWTVPSSRPPSPSLQPDEPGIVLTQTDEDMAEIENLDAMRQRGDVSAEEILAAQIPEQIRGTV